MSPAFVVTGTDTGIGKTVFAAGLAASLNACYWKPVQAGLDEETDSETVMRLGGIPADRIIPEAYRLKTPASPHRAAELDGLEIVPEALDVPSIEGPLVIEGAGGLMVPLTRRATFLDVFARWRLPVVLCATTRLGTINHTLLSLEALRHRSIPVLGVALIGPEEAGTDRIISELGNVRVLGRLPWMESVAPTTLRASMNAHFGASRLFNGAEPSATP
ncbi:dethiobiotin synthase [Pararhodospirillum oryzae]|uniref:ATP-dependent dethiobiotin synthetase BioD n=1 Tax=Pararhodospirillum oryzae TaxID=478448 RepID=A0A512H6V7_9PROT|nr:dethiobiotin synthase [Pararhodospirillum oryzae]GEO81158.1 ATP-dependent dethiobiotin synthetase BioD [Pararhodospirillum oryzae]